MSKTAFKSMHNLRRYPSSNWYEIDQKTRFKIWRSVVAPSDATEKNRNIDAQQLQSILYTTAQKDFGKFTSCRTFGAQKLVHFEPFLDYQYKVWQLLSALYSDMRKKNLYRCTSTFLALNYYIWIFFKSLSHLYEVVRTNISADFWTFRNFWSQFRKNCGAT